jgi:hypothetical protein
VFFDEGLSLHHAQPGLASNEVLNARTRNLTIAVVVAALSVVVWVSVRGSTPASPMPPSISDPSTEAPPTPVPLIAASQPSASAGATPAPEPAPSAMLAARWGSGRGELGRSRPQEGNPEGPMSFASAGEDLLVLDQVNQRVVRYDARGAVKDTFDASPTTQDIAVGKDGTVALLDRLVDKTVRLVDARGRPIGSLSLPADRVPDPGLVTGVFVDGKDVYVEKEHGVLTRIGTTDGRPAEAAELTGRPSKDGTLLLMAVLSAPEARVTLNAFDRVLGSLRFARSIPFVRPVREVVLLDTDRRGTIYLGVTAGKPPMVHVACLDPSDGRAIGRLSMPSSEVEEESFRDFVVADDGTIIASLRSEEGVEYRTARCP